MTKEILEALDAGGKDSSFENCGFAPPGAEEAKPEFPQPPDWRADFLSQQKQSACFAFERRHSGGSELSRIRGSETIRSLCRRKPGPGIGMRQGVAETGDERFEIRESRFENCGFAPPEAEDGQATDSLDPDSQNSNLKTQNSSAAALRQRAAEHLDSLRRQAEALREEFPDFDLDAALRDPDFLRLTAPGLGVDLRRAYYALHREDLDSRAARRAAEETRRRLARSLASGGLRPREGGGQEAAAALASDYRSLSRPQQLQLKQRILEAAARGEKIYP